MGLHLSPKHLSSTRIMASSYRSSRPEPPNIGCAILGRKLTIRGCCRLLGSFRLEERCLMNIDVMWLGVIRRTSEEIILWFTLAGIWIGDRSNVFIGTSSLLLAKKLLIVLFPSASRFLRKNECKRHELSHTGARPYSCDLCPFEATTFVRQDLLKRHMKRIHRIDTTKANKENSEAEVKRPCKRIKRG